MDRQSLVADAVTALFVPGDRPDRFDKAVGSGADLAILDLEDAVAADRKDAARGAVATWLAGGGVAAVRVNATGEEAHDADCAALQALPSECAPVAVMVPMASDPVEVSAISRRLGVPVIALVETARGLTAAVQIARAAGVIRLAFGALDLAADLGAEDPTLMTFARAELVIASRAAGLAGPLDGVTADLSSAEVAGADARESAAIGMGGKLCVHPVQVQAVRQAFAPPVEQIRWAQQVVAAVAGGVGRVDGRMVDEPVLRRARNVLAQAKIGPSGGDPGRGLL